MGRVRRASSITAQVVAWAVLLSAVAVLAVGVLVPRVAGATPYAVLTGSMQPRLPPGTLVVVKSVDADEVAVGDVVTYQLESGRPTVVTHRVVGLSQNLAGESSLVTQGDANDVPDADPVRPEQLRGTLWYSVPLLGHANDLMNGEERAMAINVVVAGLLLYAGLMALGAIRDRRRDRTWVDV